MTGFHTGLRIKNYELGPETPIHTLWQNIAETVAPNYSPGSDSVGHAARLPSFRPSKRRLK